MQLANVLSTEGLFYACILPFIAFFGSFAFVMYPLRDIIHPTGTHHLSRLPDCVQLTRHLLTACCVQPSVKAC